MRTRTSSLTQPRLYPILLFLFLAVLWIGGGASRADVAGQVLSRAAAAAVLMTAVIFGQRPAVAEHRGVLILFAAVVALPLAQLIPLPPDIWLKLPGRDFMAEAAKLSGQSQPWRPLSIVPSATMNAAFSLIVPAAVLLCLSGLDEDERARLPMALLALVMASTLVGLIQFSGTRFAQPLINYTRDVSGTFANRNHFAIFLALGCLIVPVWACVGRKVTSWRALVAAGLIPLFILTILASGSRAGMAAALMAVALCPWLVREDLRKALRGRPKWILPTLIAGVIAVIVLFVLVSVSLGRAVSLERLMFEDVGSDMRSRGLSTVIDMVRTYFPVGTGLGSFDTMFRLHEPLELLKRSYFNRAHDDFLEIVLDAGLPGLLLLLFAVGWWLVASVAVWRGSDAPAVVLGRLGSAILFVIFLASIVDYPARTPLIMATVAISACLLAWGRSARRRYSGSPEATLSI